MAHKNHYLLTGASGFVGQGVSALLMEKGFRVTSLNRSGALINIDIAKPFDFEKDLDPDVIVHMAGKAHAVPATQEEEKIFYDVNFEGTKNLCRALERLTVKPSAFIFISTVAVYGLESGNMISEEHPLQGETAYAKSKILAEKWLVGWAKKNSIKLGILRLPLVAGPDAPGNLGSMVNGIRSGKYLSIGEANARKSIVWRDDIADVIPILSETGGVFNLTDGLHPCFKELEFVISQKLRRKKPLTIPVFVAKILAVAGNLIGPRFPINTDKLKKLTSTLTFDDSKAQQILHWKPSSVLTKMSESL
jgi:nucleoside-diphosphate-sugar epimerase